MLGGSGLSRSVSGDGAAAAEAAPEPQESGELGGGGGGGGGAVTLTGAFSEEDKASGGGNRWPRQETLALLKIRSDMDVVFRDSSLKGPLWEQVSRKMAELGYHRNAKKCKEKFENVYKYHKRTKDGRTSKPDGKSYRFFDQLNALENITTSPSVQLALPPPSPSPRPPLAPLPTAAMSVTPIQSVNFNANANAQVTVSSTPPNIAASVAQNTPPQNFSNLMNSSFPPPPPTANNVTNPTQTNTVAAPQLNISTSFLSNSSYSSSSSATSSEEDTERRHRRKRKLKDFFEKVMKEVVEKQEDLQKKFLETLEKRERDRMIREEAWRVQEMARIHREHDLLVQERSMAAARESALIGFLQKMTDQQNSQNPQNKNATQVQIPVLLSQPPQQATPPPAIVPPLPPTTTTTTTTTTPVLSPEPLRSINNNGCDDFMGTRTSSSRWPKAEVQALINLRTTLDNKYQENGPKGPLWEEISTGMKRLGYNRSSKRCKEKWENINKYFKKVKESNKKRPEDAKTCPYFHQLDALYKERAITNPSYTNPSRPEDAMVPIMARPEQQWPLPQVHHHQQRLDEHEGDNIDRNDHQDDGDNDDDGEDDDDDEEDDEGMGYEIVTNKAPSVATSRA